MRKFYWDRTLEVPGILRDAAAHVDKYVGILSLVYFIILGLLSPRVGGRVVSAWEGVPWPWLSVGLLVWVAVVFTWGLAKANYEEFLKVEKRRKDAEADKENLNNRLEAEMNNLKTHLEGEISDLKKRLEDKNKRRDIRELLGNALEEGESLNQGRKYTLASEGHSLENFEISDEHQASYDEEVRSWVERTYSLINDAFGKAQAQRFISNEGLTDEELFGRELPPSVHLSSTRRKYLLPARLKRLHAVIDSVNSLEVNSDFDPQNVAQEYGESAAAQLRLMTALEQATVDIEKLKAASERLTAERDEAKLESRTFKSERDGQVRGRCLELSRELSDFLEEARGQDPKETMHQYNQRFRDRVDRLRSDVMRLGWWKPKESAREKLEYPTHPDDLLGLADYLNASCGHGFW